MTTGAEVHTIEILAGKRPFVIADHKMPGLILPSCRAWQPAEER
jgi:hypothetical protein